MAQTIQPTYFHDDFKDPQSTSEVTYSTLYPEVYTLTRDTVNDYLKVDVTPQPGFWRPVVIGFATANGGAQLDISANPILKAHIIVPISNTNPLKIGFYITDGSTLGEYDDITPEEYVRANLQPGTDTIFEFDWTHAKEIDWGAGGWPPTTTDSPDLSSIESLGMSMNTNSSDTGTYYVKSLEFGGLVASFDNITQSSNGLSVYPNPVRGSNIYFNKGYQDVVLYDLIGNILLEVTNVSSLNMTNISPGTYLLNCDNEVIKVHKL